MMQRKSSPYRSLGFSVLVAALLIAAKGLVETVPFGKQVELLTYNLLQMRLSRTVARDLPVVVVDITPILPRFVESSLGRELVTPREPLVAIVRAIANARGKPKAIGIDLDFSPSNSGFVTPSDAEALQAFLSIREHGVPVYVGVFDSVVRSPSEWLGRAEFRDLAAYIAIPRAAGAAPSSRMPEWVWPAGVSRSCPSLASALSQVHLKPMPGVLNWALQRVSARTTEAFAASEFLVDFGALDQLMAGRVTASNAEEIGRATPGETSDQFNVAGREDPVPGVYLHACATDTLLGAPLLRLTHAGRIVCDAFAAALVFGPVFLLGLYFQRPGRLGGIPRSLHAILTVTVILIVVAAGHLLVRHVRLLWTDYLMVIGALLLHGPIERLTEPMRDKVARQSRPGGRRVNTGTARARRKA
jgi:hypothetical protein